MYKVTLQFTARHKNLLYVTHRNSKSDAILVIEFYELTLLLCPLAGSIQKLGTTSSMNVAMSPSGSLTLDLALGEALTVSSLMVDDNESLLFFYSRRFSFYSEGNCLE
jgi:hypothetical protein